MADWIPVEGEAAVGEGEVLVADVDGLSILLVRQHGCVHAFENRCSHDGSSMEGARLEDGALVCPHHGARFALRDGEALCAPAYEPLSCFPIRVQDGVIQVMDDRW